MSLCVLAPSAGASASESLLPPGAFGVKASNGYSLLVIGVPAHKGKPSSVILFVTGKGGTATYAKAATVTEASIAADLGDLGEISMEFHPSGKPQTAHSRCGGKPVTFDSGFYEGTVSFYGEEEYTAVETTRANGTLGFLLDIVCPGISGSTGGPFLPGAQLDVRAGRSREGVHLKAVKNFPAARAHFEASLSEMRDGIAVGRYVHSIASARTFEYDQDVQVATVRPPAPFSGSAQFRRARSGNRWTGDLSVDFPGKSDVVLTEPRARAKLAHARWDW